MPRGLSGSAINQLQARMCRPVHFVRIDLPSSTIRAWTGVGTINTLSANWTGVGEFGFINGVEHDRTLRAHSVSLGLNGLPGDAVDGGAMAAIRNVRYQGRPMEIYLGFCDLNTDLLVVAPAAIWAGYVDVMSFRLGETMSVSLTGEHLTSLLRRSNGLRMTTESHNQRTGGVPVRDLFFEPQNRLMGAPAGRPGR